MVLFSKALLLFGFLLCSSASHGAKWICSMQDAKYAAVDMDMESSETGVVLTGNGPKPGNGVSVKTRFKIDRFDIMQLYTGTPVIVGSSWLKGFVRSPSISESITAFTTLGLDANTATIAEKIARSSNFSDKGLRYVNTEQEVIAGVAARHPSVGYVSNYVGGVLGVKDCFSK